MIEGLLGRKVGMIQVFDDDGRVHSATVIEAGPCVVSQIKSEETDGYTAVQLAYGTKKRPNKPMKGHFRKLGDFRHLREFKVDDPTQHKVGERVGVEIFHPGDKVDVTGTSKGRGFAGGVRRYNFRGGPKTHGQSDRHRAPGSIGSGTTPGRVFKGLRMAGHMGARQVTVRNLEVLQSNPARGILIVAGAVPGARNGLVRIRYSSQTLPKVKDRKPLDVEPEEAPAPEAAEEAAPEAAEEAEQPEAAAEEPQPEATEAEGEAPADEEPEAEASEETTEEEEQS